MTMFCFNKTTHLETIDYNLLSDDVVLSEFVKNKFILKSATREHLYNVLPSIFYWASNNVGYFSITDPENNDIPEYRYKSYVYFSSSDDAMKFILTEPFSCEKDLNENKVYIEDTKIILPSEFSVFNSDNLRIMSFFRNRIFLSIINTDITNKKVKDLYTFLSKCSKFFSIKKQFETFYGGKPHQYTVLISFESEHFKNEFKALAKEM